MAQKQQIAAPAENEALTMTEAFIDKYKKYIIYGTCGILIIAAAIISYIQFVAKPNAQKASEALFKCEKYFAAENYDKALNGDGQGCIGFLKIADEYSCTKAGNLAKLYAGICYAQTGKDQEAVGMLEDFDTKGDAIISPAAVGMLGNCYANLGQTDKAIKTLLEAAKMADNNSLSPTYLIQAGELYESLGNKEKALQIYEQIKDKYINSMSSQDIDKYIERVK
ncbi:MAG: tetratricopeptide repeat protein [Bacteroidaceae bacterium]|nr:tetratricopeptide repeat protein [Bacteroidaceae bacterium]